MQLASYVLIAKEILARYQYPEPLHLYLKKIFKQNKKYGGRDRKVISEIIYAHFRTVNFNFENLQAAYDFVIAHNNFYELQNNKIIFDSDAFNTSLTAIENLVTQANTPDLTEGLKLANWRLKSLVAPYTFIRVLRNKQNLLAQFTQANINTAIVSNDGFALPQKVKLNELKIAESDFSIQDANSQLVSNDIEIEEGDLLWDACAASGGKSIALLSRKIPCSLYVSDVRQNILNNLQQRFKIHGYKATKIFLHDATQTLKNNLSFNTVLVDAPCSGSGTWARTPEHFAFFTQQHLNGLIAIQKSILQNTWQYVKKGGRLYYITCSVFANENEKQVEDFLANNINSKLINNKLYNGETLNADYMFMAVIEKI